MIKIDDKTELRIQDIMLAQDVKRWTIVRTIKEQSLAEHSYNVTMIAMAICKKLRIDDAPAIRHALTHDLAEVLTGDIPTPAKSRLGINRKYAGNYFKSCSTTEAIIVSLADIIEALHFLIDNQVGRHANVVADYLMDRYQSRCNLYSVTHPKVIKAANEIVEELTQGAYEAENNE